MFFIAAVRMPCSLWPEQCWQLILQLFLDCVCTASRPSLFLTLPDVCPPTVAEGVRDAGSDTTRQVTQTDWRGILCHLMSGSAINWRGVGFREVTQLLLRKWLGINHGWWWTARFTLFFSTSTSALYVKQLYYLNIQLFFLFIHVFLFTHLMVWRRYTPGWFSYLWATKHHMVSSCLCKAGRK